MTPRILRTVSLAFAASLAAAAAVADSRDRPVEAPGPLAPLRASMPGPADPRSPVVLIVPGSGPTDRDGNGPLGLKASTYRLLAEGLAGKGIATVRIDKRGMFGSAAAAADPNAVTIEDYAVDVRSWVKVLRRQTGARCIWVAGHSEGGLVALTADHDNSDICGLILMATAGRPLGQVLREQLQSNPANASILDQAFPAIDALESGRRVDTTSMHPALQSLFNPRVQGFLISAFAIDPARLAADNKKPVLIVQGARDLQVGVADAERLKQAAPGSTLVFVPDANHVFKVVKPADRSANLATYGDPDRPLAPGVVDAIASFISHAAAEVHSGK